VGNFRRSSRSWTTVSRRCSTFSKARFPGNHMLTRGNERGQDNVPTCLVNVSVNAYDLIKLAHSETHCSISLRIFACVDAGWMFLKTSPFPNSNTFNIASRSDRKLSSRCNWCTKVCQQVKNKVSVPFHPTRQGRAPREHWRAESMPSWHAEGQQLTR
jgi:hypothetical protein